MMLETTESRSQALFPNTIEDGRVLSALDFKKVSILTNFLFIDTVQS